MITAFLCFVGLYVLGSCDTQHHIPSCTDVMYLEWSVVIQTCSLELR